MPTIGKIVICQSRISQQQLTNDESLGLLKIISDYAYALEILDRYDYQSLEITETSGKEKYQLTYEEAMRQVNWTKKVYGNSDLFGNPKDESFKSSIATIYQTYILYYQKSFIYRWQ